MATPTYDVPNFGTPAMAPVLDEPEPRPEPDLAAQHELRGEIQLMLNLKSIAQAPGFLWLQEHLRARLEEVRESLETLDPGKVNEILFAQAVVRVYREVIKLVPESITRGEEAAQELRRMVTRETEEVANVEEE